MTGDDESALSCDGFLGGRLRLWQPRLGYRAGVDPILLAAAVPARPGQSVLDLGCGAGAVALALGTRVRALDLHGVEKQPLYAGLAQRNAAENGVALTIWQADIAALPAGLRQRGFDHVCINPPYFDPAARSPARDTGREAARAEDTALLQWTATAGRRLKPGGHLHMVHRCDRLPDLLAAVSSLGATEVLPLAARTGRAPHLVLLRVRKGSRAPFRLWPPLVMHAGARHLHDGDDYAPQIRAVLRDAAPLGWPTARNGWATNGTVT
ncbi:MAG: methyltransferase [Rhodobacteraceae bacterium]|nr:methyltransferase [Paracoccaceae bacterium]